MKSFREFQRGALPDFHNAPVSDLVPVDGAASANLLIVGLAPGLRGANRTGLPFTGDHAGQMLIRKLADHGLAEPGEDGTPRLNACVITNAVRCVPPENRPLPAEISTCRTFLSQRIATMPLLKVVLAIGRTAHEAVLRAQNMPLKPFPFSHGSEHIPGHFRLISSYHCSRYNFNTGLLSEAMLDEVFRRVCSAL